MNINEQVEYLMQGTEYGDEQLKKNMAEELRSRLIACQKEGRPLRVYCGFDPRTTDLHLGHTVPLRKMRQFQELGHDVTFLVGTYTSLIGDPSDKDVLRPQLTPETVQENAQTYAKQVFGIGVLDRTKTQVRFNGEWLSKVTFEQLIKMASEFTIQQFLTRVNFKQRWEKGDAIYLHETFYSLMQGFDAYTLKADVQIGGTDQLFNIMTAARKIMTSLGALPNIAVIVGILPGTDGVVKMSKSLGNHIPLNTDAVDMYGKVMSIPDFAMGQFFRLVTPMTPLQIAEVENAVKDGTLHPRDAKMRLASEIVTAFYSKEQAENAQRSFIETFQKGGMPEDIAEFKLTDALPLVDLLVLTGLAKSKTDSRRLIAQQGVKLDGAILSEPAQLIQAGGILQVGKRHFLKLVK